MRILILGGTTEASAIARALVDDRRFDPVLSFAGRTRAPVAPPIPWRVGGFGGAQGLADYVRQEGVQAVVDATHPFAARIKANAAALDVPRVVVLRPEWAALPGEAVADMAAAFDALGRAAQRVLLTVGQQELGHFGPPHHYVVRSVDPPGAPPVGAIVITARGPFDEVAERTLLLAHRIEVLVTKNSGGSATAAKLAAARGLGVRVVMVARPPLPDGLIVPDAAGALAWLAHQVARRGV